MDALEILSSPITWAVTVGTLYIFYRHVFFSLISTFNFHYANMYMFVLIHRYVTSTFSYFSDQGIPGPKPVPFFGNMWGIWKSVRWPPWNIINSFHITIIIMITEYFRVRHVIGEKTRQSVRLLWRTATKPVDNRFGIDQGHLCQRFWSFCWPQSN